VFRSFIMGGSRGFGPTRFRFCSVAHRIFFMRLICGTGRVFPSTFLHDRAEGKAAVAARDMFTKWIIRRGVAVTDLWLTTYFYSNQTERIFYLQRFGCCVCNILGDAANEPVSATEATLEDVCIFCPNILAVNFIAKYWSEWFVPDGPPRPSLVHIIIKHCRSLRELWMPSNTIDNKALSMLGDRCPQLMSLRGIQGEITDSALVAVARNGALTSLSVEGYTSPTDSGLQYVAEHCPRLEELFILWGSQFTDAMLFALSQHCHKLHTLIVSCRNMTCTGLEAIAAGCPLLRVLSLYSCKGMGPAVTAIARNCPLLQIIYMCGEDLPAEAVHALAEGCRLLEEVLLPLGKAIGDIEINALVRSCPRLLRLSLLRTSVTAEGLRAVRDHCSKLEAINVDKCMFPVGEDHQCFFPSRVNVQVSKER
jgi:hypothetical protein